MRQPDFFVVGAAKSGTTALWKYLQYHSEIFVTKNITHKELGYYSNQYGISNKEQYLAFFKEANENQIIGEVCHVYLTSKESAQWIKEEVPNAKIIIMLRNPIERAFSLYNWMTMHGYEYLNTFEKAIKRERKILNRSFRIDKLEHTYLQNYLYINSGLYFEQVKRYKEIFGENNVRVIEYSDFRNNQETELMKLFKFLNVKGIKIELNKDVNVSKKLFSIRLQYYSLKLVRKNYIGKRFVKKHLETIIDYNTLKRKPKKMKKETEFYLKEFYLKDVESLSELCNYNFLDKWY